MTNKATLTFRRKGGPGSGHHGHAGRPGKRGGSTPGGGGGGSGQAKRSPLSKDTKLTKQQRAVVKAFPGGKNSYSFDDVHEYRWSKERGHGGARTIDRAMDKFRALGFKKYEEKGGVTPSDEYVHTSVRYRDDAGNEVRYSKRYGWTADYNEFDMELTLVG